MKVKNKTKWETKDLKHVFTRCLAEVNRREGNSHLLKSKFFTVSVETGKRQYPSVSGYAYYRSSGCFIRLPSPQIYQRYKDKGRFKDHPDVQSVASVFIHELHHCLGFHHSGRKGTYREVGERLYDEWIKKTFVNHVIRVGEIKEKPKPNLQLIRFERAKSNLIKAETRLKRAKTIHNKWKGKVAYYEKALAAKNITEG